MIVLLRDSLPLMGALLRAERWKEEQLEGRRRWPAQHVTPQYSWRYYGRVAAVFFVMGASIETFMIMSGFYKLKMETVEDIDKALERHYENAGFASAIKEEAEKKLRDMGKLNE